MKVERTGSAAFTAEFESEQELRDEYRLNLSQGALRLATSETVPRDAQLVVTLRGPYGAQKVIRANAVASLPDGIALATDAIAGATIDELLAPPEETSQTSWDRIRALTQNEKLLLAPKADRSERALLLQDNDPRVLLSLLRNPRITVDEVARMAKSAFLTYQIADVIMKTAQWMSSLDVRLALVHNAKTPQAFGLRILPTLPDADVRAIARAGTNMALKQAAVRRLQEKK